MFGRDFVDSFIYAAGVQYAQREAARANERAIMQNYQNSLNAMAAANQAFDQRANDQNDWISPDLPLLEYKPQDKS